MIEVINIYNLLKDLNSEKYLFSDNVKITTANLLPVEKKCLRSNIIYIGYLSEVINDDFSDLLNVVCINDIDRENISVKINLNLLVVNVRIEKEELLDKIDGYIDAYFNYIENKLSLNDAMLNDDGLTGIMNRAYSVFDNPLVFVNLNYRLVSYPQNMDVSADPDWTECINTGAAPYSFIKKILTTDPDNFNKLLIAQEPNLLEGSDDLLKNRSLGMAVSVDKKSVGFLCLLEYQKTFDDFDRLLLKTLSEIVSNEIQKERFYKQNKGLFYEHFYYDLLNDNFISASSVKERAKKLFADANQQFLIFTVKSMSPENIRLYPFYREHFEKLILNCHSIMYEDQIVFIIRYKNRRTFSDVLETYLRENKLIGGISYYFEDFLKFKEYYYQSVKAMELGNRIDPKKSLYFYVDFMPYHIFDIAKENTNDFEIFYHPFIKQLSDHDKKNKTSYTTSLKVYLKCGNNLLNASKILNIHRNTVDYHIRKINKILNIDINEPRISQLLLFSFMILEFIQSS